MLSLIDGLGYGGQHFGLLRPLLEIGKGFSKGAVRAHQTGGLGFIQMEQSIIVTAAFRLPDFGGQALQFQPGGLKQGGAALAAVAAFQSGQQVSHAPVAAAGQLLHPRQQARLQFTRPAQQQQEQLAGGVSIVNGLVRLGAGKVKLADERLQVVFRVARQQEVSQIPSIVAGISQGQTLDFQKFQVKVDVVADDGIAFEKTLQFVADRGKVRRAPDLVGSDAGQALDKIGNVFAGVDKGIKAVDNPVALKLDGPNLDNFIPPVGVQPGSFQVQGNKSPLQGGSCRELQTEGHHSRPFRLIH